MKLRALRFAAAACLTLGLAACFQPLHGSSTYSAVAPTMASIKVADITGHLGHQLQSELQFLLSNGTMPAQPEYVLNVRPSGTANPVIVDSTSSRPQTMNYPVAATYTLVSSKDGRVLSTATARGAVSYDRDPQRYATIRAERDAEIRAAKLLAEQIRTRIISDLAKQAAGG